MGESRRDLWIARVMIAETTKPTRPARYASGISSFNFRQHMCQSANSGSSNWQCKRPKRPIRGNFSIFFCEHHDRGHDHQCTDCYRKIKNFIKKIIPRPTANSGAVEVRVDERVGPRNFIPASAKFADTAGLNKPTRTKIIMAGSRRYSIFKKMEILIGREREVEMVIAARFEDPYAVIPYFGTEHPKQKKCR